MMVESAKSCFKKHSYHRKGRRKTKKGPACGTQDLRAPRHGTIDEARELRILMRD